MSEWFLTRARLKASPSIAALKRVLMPDDDDARVATAHHVVWSLFADDPDRRRDFLWRDAGEGTFYFLSRRAPSSAHDLFDIDEPKAFAPVLRVGDRLRFVLRANATVAHKVDGSDRGKPSDVVMHAIKRVASGRERVTARADAVFAAGLKWLRAQGERRGFEFDAGAGDVTVGGYRVARIPRKGADEITLGLLDFEGTLTVRDPAMFVEAVTQGFGRGKSFGNGLMLIRRAE